jgi:hypothetical protein
MAREALAGHPSARHPDVDDALAWARRHPAAGGHAETSAQEE